MTEQQFQQVSGPRENQAGTSECHALRAENEGLRAQLRLALRQASLAEVATGTLHNVSNVLNSINVSISLVVNRLNSSRTQNLSKTLALLRANRENLSVFLTEDPKGKMLPGYLETLADRLAAEQRELRNEVEGLAKNIEHVKEIVAVQQSYSRQCGATETLQVAELVQDAIRMNVGAFERHGITIERDFALVPPVTVDRHKVLQILINLMRNAKYAMDELGPPVKTLKISIGLGSNGPVQIKVQDNGIGIAPENLSRIFDHGFTTKHDGHGFGLHSGTLAAREMGGHLTAHSDGIGHGATFCLDLPPVECTVTQTQYASRSV